jgi:hypothetical protein
MNITGFYYVLLGSHNVYCVKLDFFDGVQRGRKVRFWCGIMLSL